MASVAESVTKCIEPIVEKLGYVLIDVEYKKLASGMNLTVYIDSKNGISLNDCEKVHKAIDQPLDVLDPTAGAGYTLNVSSPGLDRPLKTDKDLNLNIGVELEINLYSKQQNKKLFIGNLVRFDENQLVIRTDKEEITIERKNISKINKYISF